MIPSEEPAPDNSHFLCVGAMHWDYIGVADQVLSAGEDVPGKVVRRPGGVALNVAIGLARAGHLVSLCGAVGDDAEGADLLAAATQCGVNCDMCLRLAGHGTGRYVAVEDGSGQMIGAVADTRLASQAGDVLVQAVRHDLSGQTTLVAEANLGADQLAALANIARDRGLVLAVNPVSPVLSVRLERLVNEGRPLELVANLAEANALLSDRHTDTASAAAALIARGLSAAFITNGKDPVALATRSGVLSGTPNAVVARNVTGAGDALMAGYLSCADRQLYPANALETALDWAHRHLAANGAP
ncbi:MAG: PfkB family carbohydrate kinase [Pseudomonadota bacterium]